MRFTPDRPPRYGKAKKLWDWVKSQTGEPPDMLWVNRPGRHQRSAGRAHYIIEYDHTHYLVWSVEKTLVLSLDDADRDRRTGDMNLV